jgi:anti-sigma factor RsiW
VLSNRDQCPAQLSEIAEAYVMNTLDRAAAAAFEDHLMTCSRCAAAAEDADHYVRAMKIAAQRLRAPVVRAAGSH